MKVESFVTFESSGKIAIAGVESISTENVFFVISDSEPTIDCALTSKLNLSSSSDSKVIVESILQLDQVFVVGSSVRKR